MSSTDVATVDQQAELDLLQQQEQEFDADLFQTPILKIGQPLTREVAAGDADAGEFINTLTGDALGDKIGFIVSFYNKGRFAAPKQGPLKGRTFVAFSNEIPEAWEDLVGAEFVGTPFAEYPDAEEQYKERVNRKEIEWGSGPLISTTHNFTGLAVVSAPEGSDEPDELQPVRLSLMRTNMPAVRKWITLKRSLRNKPFYERVFDLSTERKEFTSGVSHLLNVRLGRATTADEKAEAFALAQAAAAGRVQSNEAQAEAGNVATEPDAKGGLSV
jgi:hypothetical protein